MTTHRSTVRLIPAILVLVFVSGCGRSEDELRSLIRQEIAADFAKSYITSTQVIGPYSPAVKSGPFLFVSGQIGINPNTLELVSDDLEAQTGAALTNLFTILRQAGYDSTHIVQCVVYLRDMKDFQKMNLIYGGFFTEGKYPTRTTVEVSNLPKNARVEITALAIK